MRTHGWGGQVPVNDAEAVARILAATRTTIDRRGTATSIADVARELGVTRQTVYRYFSGTEELLSATALDAVGGLLERVMTRLAGMTSPDAAIVEGIAAVLEELAEDDYVGVLLRADKLSVPVVGGFTSDDARRFARTMVDRLEASWDDHGYDDAALDLIAEIVLRTLQSMVLDAMSHRTGAELRAVLDAWAGAAVRELARRG
ncbi:TetR/AcrR family transcriptional regulator [Gordonia rubripertincta]|uniref:TetR/AcrR family transcriptional regulator n=2 Tax=Gordonia rubripertincta TaxID=36822 RepID=A0AAW6RI22_GORRU|nr:TetR/AcrR family transcriptional regulator [Gordonia rubripertincta]MDG6783750.1 TetR/AcrR family transcriptional regulator [Gordonia rubripertincta]NKY65524.1 TetR/AcrR family transcriptional regulator [Gordonia rubripertincta]GAB85318.1 putative TetR family transcriptional regulator [Gordonia rubripertincta NBRC 101908]